MDTLMQVYLYTGLFVALFGLTYLAYTLIEWRRERTPETARSFLRALVAVPLVIVFWPLGLPLLVLALAGQAARDLEVK